jgi:sec-independent protein translocase protein TatC
MSVLRKIFRFREESDDKAIKPFLEHLEDLRWTLIKMFFTLAIAMGLSLGFRKSLVKVIQAPLNTIDPELAANLRTFGVVDSLTISFQLAFYAGIIVSFPILLFLLAQFVLPALTRQEKKYVIPGVFVGFGLFLIGVVFCYFFVLPQTLKFFFEDARSLDWEPTWTVRDYFSFVTHITLAFGAAFELPVLILTLVYLGFVNFSFLSRTRPYGIVIILLLAVVISPTPDILTFLSLGAPMILLYELCIWLAWFIERWKEKRNTV